MVTTKKKDKGSGPVHCVPGPSFIEIRGRKVPIKIEYIPLGEKENEERIDKLARLILRVVERTKRRNRERSK